MTTSPKPFPKIVAVASGKGGMGKSLVAANLGVFLATLSNRVALVDCAFGSASLHAYVGVREPQAGVSALLSGEQSFEELVQNTSVPGLGLIAGRGDAPWVANPRPRQLARLLECARASEFDFVIMDLCAGTGAAVAELVAQADVPVVVVNPEGTSIELGYRLMKTAFLRKLADAPDRAAMKAVVLSTGVPLPAPADLCRAVRGKGDESEAFVRKAVMEFVPGIVVNRVRSKTDIDVGLAMIRHSRRRLGVPTRYLGHIENDEAVWISQRAIRPLLIEHPEARVSKCIEKVTRRLFGRDQLPSFEELYEPPTYYDLLGVEPAASYEEVRRGNRKARQELDASSAIVWGLYDSAELSVLHRDMDRAYETLMDATRRREYDQELFPEGRPTKLPSREFSAVAPIMGELPPMPEITGDSEFSGELLRQVRRAQGLDLRDIAEKTKIGMTYLEAIEDERFSKLPPVVYVRGFLTQYAKMLELDSIRVVDTYIERIRSAAS